MVTKRCISFLLEGSGPERLVCTYHPTVPIPQVPGRCGHRPLRDVGPGCKTPRKPWLNSDKELIYLSTVS